MDVDVFEAKCMADDEVIVGKKSIRPQPMPDEKGILFQKPVQKIKVFSSDTASGQAPSISLYQTSKRQNGFGFFGISVCDTSRSA